MPSLPHCCLTHKYSSEPSGVTRARLYGGHDPRPKGTTSTWAHTAPMLDYQKNKEGGMAHFVRVKNKLLNLDNVDYMNLDEGVDHGLRIMAPAPSSFLVRRRSS